MTRKNILILTTTFPNKKDDIVTARFVLDLSRALTGYYNVHVLAPSSPGAKALEDFDGVKVHRFRYFTPASLQLLTTGDGILANLKKNGLLALQVPFLLMAELIAAIRLIRKEKIEVINSHWIIPQGLIAALISKPMRIRHVLTIHAADIFALKRWGRMGTSIARYIIRRSDKVIAVSNYIKSVIDDVVRLEYDFIIMPMGVRMEAFNNKDAGSAGIKKDKSNKVLDILFVGKMAEKKGLKYLLDALSIVKKEGLSFKLDVVGGGLLEPDLKNYAAAAGLKEEIVFHGWVGNEKLPEFYRRCDIVAVPSIFDKKGETEGMPVVVLEAMAMSRPVLGSLISGIPDIVKDGYNGWLTIPGDARSIAGKIREAYNSDIAEFGRNSYKTAEKFSYEKVALLYKDAIE